jgi:hypothetical protein
MDNNKNLRNLIIRWLNGETHMSFTSAVEKFPIEHINEFPPNVSYTPWHLLEHIRITQSDILNFIKNKNYRYLSWPEDYWPKNSIMANENIWKNTLEQYNKDLEELKEIALNPNTDLYKVIPWGTGQTIFEELLKVADHTTYHIGEFAILRQVMSTWAKDRKI